MTYQETLDWLFCKLPMFQSVGQKAYKADLKNSLALSAYFQKPESTYKTIHVAGTNGKGSTTHILASVLQEAGYKVGVFSSPHLKDFTERIKINGTPCAQDFVVDFVAQHKNKLEELEVSFFEMTSAMAFQYFSIQKVDVAIIEVGLGGRLDSTNIISPILSIITNISFDHVAILGNTLAEIAVEKAGIIKPNTPVVIGKKQIETENVFREKAMLVKAPIYFAEDNDIKDYLSDLKGDYQQENKQTVLCAVAILNKNNFHISEKHIENGMLNVVKNTSFFGRWQVLSQQPLVVCDTAHNEAGLKYVISQIKKQKYTTLHLVLGFVRDKNVAEILKLFPKEAKYYFSAPNLERKLPVEELETLVPDDFVYTSYYESVEVAFVAAKTHAQPDDFIFIGGSTFVVAEII